MLCDLNGRLWTVLMETISPDKAWTTRRGQSTSVEPVVLKLCQIAVQTVQAESGELWFISAKGRRAVAPGGPVVNDRHPMAASPA